MIFFLIVLFILLCVWCRVLWGSCFSVPPHYVLSSYHLPTCEVRRKRTPTCSSFSLEQTDTSLSVWGSRKFPRVFWLNLLWVCDLSPMSVLPSRHLWIWSIFWFYSFSFSSSSSSSSYSFSLTTNWYASLCVQLYSSLVLVRLGRANLARSLSVTAREPADSGVWSLESGVRIQESEIRNQASRIRSQESVVCSL